MCKAIVLKRLLPFFCSAAIGLFAAGQLLNSRKDIPPPPAVPEFASATAAEPVPKIVKGVKFNYLPKAVYTDAARDADISGNVRLRVTLLADGHVGDIVVVSGLPYGLTEQAIEAAKKIKFEPAQGENGPVSKTVTLEYGFEIY